MSRDLSADAQAIKEGRNERTLPPKPDVPQRREFIRTWVQVQKRPKPQ